MEDQPEGRRGWPRVTLTIPPDARDRLRELAADNFRDPKREALRILLDGIDRAERQAAAVKSAHKVADQ